MLYYFLYIFPEGIFHRGLKSRMYFFLNSMLLFYSYLLRYTFLGVFIYSTRNTDVFIRCTGVRLFADNACSFLYCLSLLRVISCRRRTLCDASIYYFVHPLSIASPLCIIFHIIIIYCCSSSGQSASARR